MSWCQHSPDGRQSSASSQHRHCPGTGLQQSPEIPGLLLGIPLCTAVPPHPPPSCGGTLAPLHSSQGPGWAQGTVFTSVSPHHLINKKKKTTNHFFCSTFKIKHLDFFQSITFLLPHLIFLPSKFNRLAKSLLFHNQSPARQIQSHRPST